ncbi:MAG: hypothetical protein ACX98W_06555, partial [bacterium]
MSRTDRGSAFGRLRRGSLVSRPGWRSCGSRGALSRVFAWAFGAFGAIGSMGAIGPADAVADPAPLLGANATLAEIEACTTRNLPESAGVIVFRVDAIDRSGEVTSSRAELRWRKDEDALARVLLSVSAPARTAGTALLIVDRESEQP